MALFEQIVLEDTIEINTTPEKIWEFFIFEEAIASFSLWGS